MQHTQHAQKLYQKHPKKGEFSEKVWFDCCNALNDCAATSYWRMLSSRSRRTGGVDAGAGERSAA
ncbi:MAG: hypothetical protein FJ125_17830 [Deltaproteobacteria bacterium]|nr:hypothetical protein [Deltaproteobacteria bacterium]